MAHTKLTQADRGPNPQRLGGVSFLVYVSFYLIFIALETLAPQAMSDTEIALGADRTLTLWGTNLGVVYGIGLILASIFFCHIQMRGTAMSRADSIDD